MEMDLEILVLKMDDIKVDLEEQNVIILLEVEDIHVHRLAVEVAVSLVLLLAL